MKPESAEVLARYLIAIGDDELVLAHRNSEWAGHAPILEEDIAFANIALDEMGHAAAWYRLAAELLGQSPETYPDEIVFSRPADQFRSIQMMELPNGDWAYSMLRQYLFDSLEAVRLKVLSVNEWSPLADTAAKIGPEELYHLRHTSAWVRRLGLGTEESNRRMQEALNQLYPYAMQLFVFEEGNELLPNSHELREAWEAEVRPVLSETNLKIPEIDGSIIASRDEHTPHLAELVEELQMVSRLEEGSQW